MTIYSNRPRGGAQIKIIDVNDKEFGTWGGDDTVDEDFCRSETCCSRGLVPWIFNLVASNGQSSTFFFLFVILMSTTNEPYVTFRPFGISDLRMHRIVFVLKSLLISFAVDLC
jgi:hypothetical protein